MKKVISIILFVSMALIASQALSENMILGDERSIYQPTDKDFERITKGIEYLNAKQLYAEAQIRYSETVNDANSSGLSKGSYAGRLDSSVPRELRGSKTGDSYLDNRGNTVEVEVEPTTYISTISGMSGNLSAELIWGTSVLYVRRGDSLIGGAWKVDRINRDDIIIKRNGQTIRIGKLPIKISSIVNK